MPSRFARSVFCLCLALMMAGQPLQGRPAAKPPDREDLLRLADFAVQHRLLLIGELHGTVEMPAFAGRVVEAVGSSAPVTLALEWPRSEQAAVDAFLASDAGRDARERITGSEFWTSNPDGRTSQAMLALLESVRRAIAAGRDVRVLCFDGDEEQLAGADRDAVLAHNLQREREREPGRVLVALTGNYHARIAVGAPWNEDQAFAGHHLRESDPFNVNLVAQSGSAWMCVAGQGCGAHALGTGEGPAGLEVAGWPNQTGYRSIWRVGSVSASPPAE